MERVPSSAHSHVTTQDTTDPKGCGKPLYISCDTRSSTETQQGSTMTMVAWDDVGDNDDGTQSISVQNNNRYCRYVSFSRMSDRHSSILESSNALDE